VALPHRPVMAEEVIEALHPTDGGFYVDGTLGAGGHAARILEASAPGGRLLGLDRDPAALELAGRRLAPFGDRVELVQASFDELDRFLPHLAPGGADGILLDLGVSSMQLDMVQRGFSFRGDAPLDMRMAPEGPTAAEILARAEERELVEIFGRLGEEPFARRVAQAVIRARQREPVATTGQLARLVEQAIPAAARRKRRRHPATRVFMGLRIRVNQELKRLERFLERVPAWLRTGGVLAVISYHSLEDRRVKKALRRYADPCTCPPELAVCVCGRKPLFSLPRRRALKPGEQEVAENPRARSARLRVAVRTGEEWS